MNIFDRYDNTEPLQAGFSKLHRVGLVATMPCFLFVWLCAALLAAKFWPEDFLPVLLYGIYFVCLGGLIAILFLVHAVLILVDAPEQRVKQTLVPTIAGISGLLIAAYIVVFVGGAFSPQ